MKVICCADIHLDGSFKENPKDTAYQAQRRQDVRNTFLRVIEITRQQQASLLLIAGDLFDGDKVTPDTLTFLKEAFASIPDTYVLISPGNNDCANAISPYKTEVWPENVYIFTGDLEAVELTMPETAERIRIYGGGFKAPFTQTPLLQENHLPELDPASINILLMHAALAPNSTCNPITEEILNQCGFDFCVLGHQHAGSGVVTLSNTFYAYPGCCEAKGFGATGGILTGVIAHGYQNLEYMDVSSRHYVEASLDITDMESHEEICRAVRANFPTNEDLYRITLTGVAHPTLKVSVKSLMQALAPDYFYIRLRANLSIDTDNIRPLKTGLLKDYFLKEATREDVQENTDAELLRLAVQYGLAALEEDRMAEDVLCREEFWPNED